MTDSMIAERIRRIAKSILADEEDAMQDAPIPAPKEESAPEQAQQPAQEEKAQEEKKAPEGDESVQKGGNLDAELKEMLLKMVYKVGDYISIQASGISNDDFVTAVVQFKIAVQPEIKLSEIDTVARVFSDASKYLDDCMDKIEQWGTDNGVEISFKD